MLPQGGYDDGYKQCPCFWGAAPGSLIRILDGRFSTYSGLSVLDVGCGEGKNAIHLARKGANVLAVDVSERAIANAKLNWPDHALVSWQVEDVRVAPIAAKSFDIVIAYGLLHCLSTLAEVGRVIASLQESAKDNGVHVVCAFNNRRQDLSAHPGFHPILLQHDVYVDAYRSWAIEHVSDEDLFETHPHNGIPHVHSLTRIIASKRLLK